MLPRLFAPRVLAAARPATTILRPAAFSSASVFRQQQQQQQQELTPAPAPTPVPAAPTDRTPTAPPLSHETLSMLPLLLSQPQHYITIHIHGVPFLVTRGDSITLPFLLKGVSVGQTLRLTHASVLGSRDYTLKGAPFLDTRLFSCRATVIAETAEPLRVKEKTKRRNRRVKKVKSKHSYTVLRIKEVVVKNPFAEEEEGGKGEVVV
jgi:large subunit ribosomal protein L21